jgi:DNA-binding MarR family transcriptional regulator
MPERAAELLPSLVDEVVRTFHHLRAASAALHGDGEQSASRRGVLRGLARTGPRTVPQMARDRPVSRQFIQQLVNGLVADGLVELAANPAHARSHLVRLTAAGQAEVEAMARVEAQLYERIAARFDAGDLAMAVRALGELRGALATLLEEET